MCFSEVNFNYRPIISLMFVARRCTLLINLYVATRIKFLFSHGFSKDAVLAVKHKLHIWRRKWFLKSHCHPVLELFCILLFSAVRLPSVCASQCSVKLAFSLKGEKVIHMLRCLPSSSTFLSKYFLIRAEAMYSVKSAKGADELHPELTTCSCNGRPSESVCQIRF